MAFWIFMLAMDLLVPFTMLIFGWLFLKKPPRNVNGAYGYRTSMSTKNRETWAFAHQYCGRLWFRWGLGMLPVSVIAMCLCLNKDMDTIGNMGGAVCMVQCVILVLTILPTERALKKQFDREGRRRKD